MIIYEPSDDSFLLEEQVKLFSKGKTFLDIGTGSGIQSIAAKSSGAKSILSSDINTESLDKLNPLGFNTIKSDLFSNIQGKFDIITFNPPYLPEDIREDKESKIITTGGKKGDEIILRFLKEINKHLTDKGFALLVISSLTPKKRIIKLLNEKKLKKEILSKKNLFMETLEVWKISIKVNN